MCEKMRRDASKIRRRHLDIVPMRYGTSAVVCGPDKHVMYSKWERGTRGVPGLTTAVRGMASLTCRTRNSWIGCACLGRELCHSELGCDVIASWVPTDAVPRLYSAHIWHCVGSSRPPSSTLQPNKILPVPGLYVHLPELPYSNLDNRLYDLANKPRSRRCPDNYEDRRELLKIYEDAGLIGDAFHFYKLCTHWVKIKPVEFGVNPHGAAGVGVADPYPSTNAVVSFWDSAEDRHWMRRWYPALGEEGQKLLEASFTVLDIGARNYTTNVLSEELLLKERKQDHALRYFQLEPTPPVWVHNDGLLVTTVQDAALKFPEFRHYFQAIVDFGVVGWGPTLERIKNSPARESSKERPSSEMSEYEKTRDVPSSVLEARTLVRDGEMQMSSGDATSHRPRSSNVAGDRTVLAGGLEGYFANIFYLLAEGGVYAVKVDNDDVAAQLQLEQHLLDTKFFCGRSGSPGAAPPAEELFTGVASCGFEKLDSFPRQEFPYGEKVDGFGARVYYFRKRWEEKN